MGGGYDQLINFPTPSRKLFLLADLIFSSRQEEGKKVKLFLLQIKFFHLPTGKKNLQEPTAIKNYL